MKEMQIFDYENNHVRTITKDNEPWFVLRDVCDVLELSNSRMVSDRLDEDEVSSAYVIDSMGRSQETTIINESGLYTVIIRSDKPESKPFRRWVTHEVLPSIRKTGAYNNNPLKVAPLSPESAGGVARLIAVIRSTMKDNGQPPESISQAVQVMCKQFGIELPIGFVRTSPFEQMPLMLYENKEETT